MKHLQILVLFNKYVFIIMFFINNGHLIFTNYIYTLKLKHYFTFTNSRILLFIGEWLFLRY